jgi:predicted enzyme related to lactoylglutathione lyase
MAIPSITRIAGTHYNEGLEGIEMPPTLGNGKICYLEIPASDIARSADFYGRVFGWRVRHRGDGSTAFDDGVGEVSGTWVLGRAPAAAPGILIYVMVDSAAATVDAIIEAGGEIVQEISADAPEITARFRDPAGNVMGIYQQRA